MLELGDLPRTFLEQRLFGQITLMQRNWKYPRTRLREAYAAPRAKTWNAQVRAERQCEPFNKLRAGSGAPLTGGVLILGQLHIVSTTRNCALPLIMRS